jgi:hypothetical protein
LTSPFFFCTLLLSRYSIWEWDTGKKERGDKTMAAVKFEIVEEAAWDALKPTSEKKPGFWDEVLGVLESGKIVTLDVTPETLKAMGFKTIGGVRIGLGRTATGRGMRLDYRTQGNTLAVRRVDESKSETKAETKGQKDAKK